MPPPSTRTRWLTLLPLAAWWLSADTRRGETRCSSASPSFRRGSGRRTRPSTRSSSGARARSSWSSRPGRRTGAARWAWSLVPSRCSWPASRSATASPPTSRSEPHRRVSAGALAVPAPQAVGRFVWGDAHRVSSFMPWLRTRRLHRDRRPRARDRRSGLACPTVRPPAAARVVLLGDWRSRRCSCLLFAQVPHIFGVPTPAWLIRVVAELRAGQRFMVPISGARRSSRASPGPGRAVGGGRVLAVRSSRVGDRARRLRQRPNGYMTDGPRRLRRRVALDAADGPVLHLPWGFETATRTRPCLIRGYPQPLVNTCIAVVPVERAVAVARRDGIVGRSVRAASRLARDRGVRYLIVDRVERVHRTGPR